MWKSSNFSHECAVGETQKYPIDISHSCVNQHVQYKSDHDFCLVDYICNCTYIFKLTFIFFVWVIVLQRRIITKHDRVIAEWFSVIRLIIYSIRIVVILTFWRHVTYKKIYTFKIYRHLHQIMQQAHNLVITKLRSNWRLFHAPIHTEIDIRYIIINMNFYINVNNFVTEFSLCEKKNILYLFVKYALIISNIYYATPK